MMTSANNNRKPLKLIKPVKPTFTKISNCIFVRDPNHIRALTRVSSHLSIYNLQDSSGAIRADETSKSSTVVTAFQINAGVQAQTGGGCATMPAQPGCPFDRAQIIAPPLPDAPPPPLPEDAPPLPTEACEKPAPPPDEAEGRTIILTL